MPEEALARQRRADALDRSNRGLASSSMGTGTFFCFRRLLPEHRIEDYDRPIKHEHDRIPRAVTTSAYRAKFLGIHSTQRNMLVAPQTTDETKSQRVSGAHRVNRMSDQHHCARGDEKHKQPTHGRRQRREGTRSSLHSQKPSDWNRYSAAR